MERKQYLDKSGLEALIAKIKSDLTNIQFNYASADKALETKVADAYKEADNKVIEKIEAETEARKTADESIRKSIQDVKDLGPFNFIGVTKERPSGASVSLVGLEEPVTVKKGDVVLFDEGEDSINRYSEYLYLGTDSELNGWEQFGERIDSIETSTIEALWGDIIKIG